jgi:Uma2 family endonuclease
MTAIIRRVTVEDLATFPNDGHRYEIVAGELHVSPSPERRHQALAFRLAMLLGTYLAKHRLGYAYFAPVDVRLSEHDQVRPDLLFIRAEHSHFYQGDTVHGAPDFVIEILSASTRSYDELVKWQLYERYGVLEYWLVDPHAETIRLFELQNATHRAATDREGVLCSKVLPGFEIVASTLFSDLDA